MDVFHHFLFEGFPKATKPKWYGFFQGLHAPWKIPGGLHSLSGMVFSRGLMTPEKFQEVTEALMAWIFPGGLEISRGPWKNPGNLPISLWSQSVPVAPDFGFLSVQSGLYSVQTSLRFS